MITVTLYTRAGCELCKQAEEDLKTLQEKIPHQLAILDIDSDSSLRDTFALEIPVVEVGPFRLKAPFTRQELQMTLGAAADRRSQLETINDKTFQVNTSRTQTVSKADKISYWISKHYLAIFNLFLILYLGVPFLAPIFKKGGWNSPAEVVYKIYSPL
jgi:glutaredoxin